MSDDAVPEVLWRPSPEQLERSACAQLARDVGAEDYAALHAWSVADVGRFWTTLWDRLDVPFDGSLEPALASAQMPGADWFPNARVNLAEVVFQGREDPDAIALQAAGEVRDTEVWSWGRLREETARIRAGLVELGVGEGDRVAGYLPHVPETVAAFLATASLGAVWSCCSPDFGPRTVLDRFAQIEPKVLLAVDGYRYGGKAFDRTAVVGELVAALPSLTRTVRLGYLDAEAGDWDDAFPQTDAALEFARVPFGHPLWVLYSSGTTGLPKAIVHGHGGVALEGLKAWTIQMDAGAEDRLLWFTTTGWVMWNILVQGLLGQSSIVLYDGNPGFPTLDRLWDVCEETGVTVFGTGAAYLHGCLKAGVTPRTEARPLAGLKAIGSTGSPLSPDGFRWVMDELGPETWLFSISGGTDIAGAFVGGSPMLPVHLGELQARGLGIDAQAWDEAGNAVIDEVGELVITQPMPSMPVGFWNDPGHERYTEAYFEMFPGVWRHGDWIRFTPRGSCVIYGRSDSTINRAGIRMGTAELYASVLHADAVVDAMVVDVPDPSGLGDGTMYLFVVLAEGAQLDDALLKELRTRLRSDCSPRHVPDEVHAVSGVPRTLTGKVLEVPVKRMLMGQDPEKVASKDALADPAVFAWFADFARQRATVAG